MNGSNFSNSDGGSSDKYYNGEYPKNEGFEGSKIDLKYFLAAFKQHKKFILGFIGLCMVAALLYSYTKTPVYQSTGSIMIQESPENRSSSDSELANLLNKTYGIGANNTLENELQFLRSRQITKNMADKLLKDPRMSDGTPYPILWKNYPQDSTMTNQDTVASRIQKKISFNQVSRDADLIQVSFLSISPQEAERLVNLAMETYTSTATDINRKTANSAVDFLEEEQSRLKDKLQSSEQNLRSFMNESNMVEVDAQTQDMISSLTQLETERQTVRADLVAVTSAIEEYEKRLNNIKPGLSEQYAQASGPVLNRLQYQLAELQTQKTLYISKNPGLEERENPPQAYKRLLGEIEYVQGEIRKLTEKVTTENDQYLGMLSENGSVPQEVNQINQKLAELQAEKSQYEAKAEVLDERLNEQRQFFGKLPDNMMDMARMKRDRDINEEMYRTVSEQYNEMTLWQKTQFGAGRVVDDALEPSNPVSPNRKLYLLISFFVGCIFSVGYLIIRDSFGGQIDSVQKLKDRGYPVLGIIPVLQKGTKKKMSSDSISLIDKEISPGLISVHDPISPGTEAFRRMNYNIMYSQSDDDEDACKTILVTSSTKGEGKTTTISNLAVVLAEAKNRVIIVDTDLGQPFVHNMFGIDRSPGVVDVIRGDVKLSDAIESPPYVSNVDILPSGSLSTNPASINQNPKFKYLLENLRMNYDYVLIDTAPYGIVTDAAPIMKMADGILMVTRFRKTEELELDHTLEYLQKIRANILGFSISAFDPSRSTDYYNSSSYYRTTYNDYYSHTRGMMSSGDNN
jgi:capsular exopolysaccharide synthesis family protein